MGSTGAFLVLDLILHPTEFPTFTSFFRMSGRIGWPRESAEGSRSLKRGGWQGFRAGLKECIGIGAISSPQKKQDEYYITYDKYIYISDTIRYEYTPHISKLHHIQRKELLEIVHVRKNQWKNIMAKEQSTKHLGNQTCQ